MPLLKIWKNYDKKTRWYFFPATNFQNGISSTILVKILKNWKNKVTLIFTNLRMLRLAHFSYPTKPTPVTIPSMWLTLRKIENTMWLVDYYIRRCWLRIIGYFFDPVESICQYFNPSLFCKVKKGPFLSILQIFKLMYGAKFWILYTTFDSLSTF